jgi:hypothetical protein
LFQATFQIKHGRFVYVCVNPQQTRFVDLSYVCLTLRVHFYVLDLVDDKTRISQMLERGKYDAD